jgi:hypothetical protein
VIDPGANGLPRRLGDLELHGSLGFLLQHDRARGYGLTMTDIAHLELYEIAGTELAVDGQIEQGEFAAPTGELQANANGPNLFQLEGCLLPDELALIPGRLYR